MACHRNERAPHNRVGDVSIAGGVSGSGVAGGSLSLSSGVGGTGASSGAVSISSGSASGLDASGAVTVRIGVAVSGLSGPLSFVWRRL
jgi:hypothetical protein